MKKIIISLIIVMTAISSWAQNQSPEHLTFKGVPLDGKLNEFVLKMKNNGFTHVNTKDGVAMLKGDFAGYKDCIVGVSTQKQLDLVSKIVVIFPECDTWSSLSSNYFTIKELLSEKYGKPSESSEIFQTSSEPKDDGSKFYEVQFERCKYLTLYETDNGKIELSIIGSILKCYVLLKYYDKTNNDIVKAKALEDL